MRSRSIQSFVTLASILSAVGCAKSHSAELTPTDAGPMDAGDHIPGDPGMRADLEVWIQYCVRAVPLFVGESRAQAEVICRHDIVFDLSCQPTIREMNHCLDVGRGLYDGTPLDVTAIPTCHNMCPHPDGG